MRRFKTDLASRFFLKYHMAAILFVAIAAGVLASKVLLSYGLDRVVVRYPLSVVASFAAFVLTMRLWLAYLSRAYSPQCRLVEEFEEEAPFSSPSKKDSGFDLSSMDLSDWDVADDPCGCLFIVFLGFVLIIGASAVTLVYEAPLILGEVAFQFFLAAGLVRTARKIDSPNWVGSVLSSTWKPFVIVLVASIVFGCVAELTCENPISFPEMIKTCGSNG